MSEKKLEENIDQIEGDFFLDMIDVEEVSNIFLEESGKIIETLDELIIEIEESPDDPEKINNLFRKIHTIKGSVGAVPGGQLIGSIAHEFEALLFRIKQEQRKVNKECVEIFLKSSRLLDVLVQSIVEKRSPFPEEISESIELISAYGQFQFKDSGESPSSLNQRPQRESGRDSHAGVWLPAHQLTEFQKLAGELLILKNHFQMMNQNGVLRTQPDLFERRYGEFAQNLGKLCHQFQDKIIAVAKEPVAEVFKSLHMVVRKASSELDKAVNFEIRGSEISIDRELGRDLSEAFVHLVRNSIDHGIEDQFDRALKGKPSSGSLVLSIEETSNLLHISVSDDGQGLNPEKILRRACEKGIVAEAEASNLSEDQILQLVFNEGLSTKEKVTTISGRGVGMQVVLEVVQKYQGKVSIENKIGEGVCFRFDIPKPQNLTVERALVCSWHGFQIAMPLGAVAEVRLADDMQTNYLGDLRLCQFNGKTIPLMNYSEILNHQQHGRRGALRGAVVVFLHSNDKILGLLVDKVESQIDLVLKPFSKLVRSQRGFKGFSVLADDKVTYVVNPDEMINLVALNGSEQVAA